MKTRLKGVKKLVFDEQLEAANNACFLECLQFKLSVNQTILEGVISSQKLEMSLRHTLHIVNIKGCMLWLLESGQGGDLESSKCCEHLWTPPWDIVKGRPLRGGSQITKMLLPKG